MPVTKPIVRFITRFNNGLTFTQEVAVKDIECCNIDRLIQALSNHMVVTMIKSMFKEEHESSDNIIY